MQSNNDQNQSFVRWQAITIGQLTYSINLILGFAIATLGFQISLLFNPAFEPATWRKYLYTAAILLVLSSIVLGIAVVINRLRDFRITTEISKTRDSNIDENLTVIQRSLSKKWGANTWRLFWSQLVTFGAGILLMVISIVTSCSISYKLW